MTKDRMHDASSLFYIKIKNIHKWLNKCAIRSPGQGHILVPNGHKEITRSAFQFWGWHFDCINNILSLINTI